MRKARSAKGEIVDFDMIDIKQQLANIPTQVNVSLRQQYVDEKSSKAKPKPGVVPEYIQAAEWNVLSTDTTQHGDLEVHISQNEPAQVEQSPIAVTATPVRKK